MFVFDNVLDKDVNLYEYELYKSNQVTGSFPNYTLVSNPTIYLTGNSGSNVFAVAVENSTDETSIRYYGRVRTKDTSNNYSSWSPLVLSDQDTPLIGNQYVASLTAAKITAGTIGAHQIILSQAGPQTNIAAPANMAILRSSDYDGSYNSNTSTWTNGSSGWIVAGDGHAEFSSASIRGGLKAGSVYINADNRWRRNADDTAASSEFKVGSSTKYLYFDGTDLTFTGNLSAAGGTFTGNLSAAGGTFSGALSGGTISIGSGNSIFKADTNGIYLGNATFASAPFGVTPGGALTATNANITGIINSTGGTIGDLSIQDGAIEYTDASGNHMRLGPQVWPTNNRRASIIVSQVSNFGDFTQILPTQIFTTGTVYANFVDSTFGRYQDLQVISLSPYSSASAYVYINSRTGIHFSASGLIKENFGVAIGYTNGSPGAGFYIIADNNSSTQGRITTTSPSDRRLKNNIQNITAETLNKIYSLNPKEYVLGDNYPIESLRGKKDIGLIADEVSDIFPDSVLMNSIERHIVHSYEKDGNSLTEEQMNLYGYGPYELQEDGIYRTAEYKQIDYVSFVPKLLAAIKDLNARVAELEQ